MVLLLRLISAIFLAELLGIIGFFLALSFFSLEIDPDKRDSLLLVIAFSNAVAAVAGVIGFRVGSRIFEGITGAGV